MISRSRLLSSLGIILPQILHIITEPLWFNLFPGRTSPWSSAYINRRSRYCWSLWRICNWCCYMLLINRLSSISLRWRGDWSCTLGTAFVLLWTEGERLQPVGLVHFTGGLSCLTDGTGWELAYLGNYVLSVSIVCFIFGEWTGVYLRRNFLFRSVTLPDPSTRTTYRSNWRTSITQPVLSHLSGVGPVWFWILTRSPTMSDSKCLVCSESCSADFICRCFVWLVSSRKNGNTILYRSTKNAHCKWQLSVSVRSIPVLQYCTL